MRYACLVFNILVYVLYVLRLSLAPKESRQGQCQLKFLYQEAVDHTLRFSVLQEVGTVQCLDTWVLALLGWPTCSLTTDLSDQRSKIKHAQASLL